MGGQLSGKKMTLGEKIRYLREVEGSPCAARTAP